MILLWHHVPKWIYSYSSKQTGPFYCAVLIGCFGCVRSAVFGDEYLALLINRYTVAHASIMPQDKEMCLMAHEHLMSPWSWELMTHAIRKQNATMQPLTPLPPLSSSLSSSHPPSISISITNTHTCMHTNTDSWLTHRSSSCVSPRKSSFGSFVNEL